MPDISGEELIGKIKAIDKNIKIVIISGKVDTSKLELQNIGAFAFIEKPFQFFEIFSILNDIAAL